MVHDKTFKVPEAGTVQVVNSAGDVLIEHDVEKGISGAPINQGCAPIQTGSSSLSTALACPHGHLLATGSRARPRR